MIFNSLATWNSYRGPLIGRGASTSFDFHRVALHEFGHVLGLDHPEQENGERIFAMMNSLIDDLDHITDDDIVGARELYKTPTAATGFEFSYQAVLAMTSIPSGRAIFRPA